jgi:hypothetical protein
LTKEVNMDEKTELQQMQGKQEMEEYRVPPPHYPWPTSKPGPFVKAPPPGQIPVPTRTDQMVEIAYNQETGEPATNDPRRQLADETTTGPVGFDQQETVQDIERKREQK